MTDAGLRARWSIAQLYSLQRANVLASSVPHTSSESSVPANRECFRRRASGSVCRAVCGSASSLARRCSAPGLPATWCCAEPWLSSAVLPRCRALAGEQCPNHNVSRVHVIYKQFSVPNIPCVKDLGITGELQFYLLHAVEGEGGLLIRLLPQEHSGIRRLIGQI